MRKKMGRGGKSAKVGLVKEFDSEAKAVGTAKQPGSKATPGFVLQ